MPDADARSSVEALHGWHEAQLGGPSPALRRDLAATHDIVEGRYVSKDDPLVLGAYMRGRLDTLPYSSVRTPALAMFVTSPPAHPLESLSDGQRAAIDTHRREVIEPWRDAEIQAFEQGIACPVVERLEDTHLYLFIQRRDASAHRIQAFLERESPCADPA